MGSTKSSLASQLATSTTTYRPTTARNHYTTQSSPSPSLPSSESSSVPTSLGDLDLASYGVRIFKGASGGVGTTKRPSVSVKASYSTVSKKTGTI
uniref:Uncharacterized protein n=1 Tax=Tetranychus urticae TaxID=32264 RepID=T1JWD2_TETUR